MKIALDLDGTLADQHSVILPLVSSLKGVPITVDLIDDYLALRKYGWKDEEVWAFYRTLWVKFNLDAIQPFERDVSFWVKKLMDLGHTIDIVTSHSGEGDEVQPIRDWLTKWGIVYNKIEFVGPKGKKETLDYDVYIDDSPYLAKALSDTKTKHLLIYSQPWNASIDSNSNPNVRRITSFKEAIPIIQSWEEDGRKVL